MAHPLKIFSGNSNIDFAEKVANHAGIQLCKCDIGQFKDGEVQVEIQESIRGSNCFVIQSTCPPVNNNYMELFIMLDAMRRASANEITAVLPYYGYARQDRKVAPRAPISAKAVANLLKTAGADRLVSVDLHSPQIQGFFNGPVDHLYAKTTLAEAWIQRFGKGSDYVVVSPDSGGVERARAFAKRIEAPIAIIDKRRSGPNKARAFNLIGDVQGKIAVIIDDIIDTAGTLTQSIDSLINNGAKRVFAIATHSVFSNPALERLIGCKAEKVFVTDTIPLSKAASECDKIEVISIAPVVAKAIHRINNYESVSELFQ